MKVKLLFIIFLQQLIFAPSLSAKETLPTPQIKQLKDQLKTSPDNLNIRSKLAAQYFKQKKYKEASDILDPYSAELPIKSMDLLAKSFELQKNFLSEIRVLKIILSSQPKNHLYHLRLGHAYLNNKMDKEAIESIRKAISLRPKSVKAHQALLKVFKMQKNNYESRLIVLDMIKKFGEMPEFINELCRIYTEEAYLEEAIRYCQKAISLNHLYPENHAHLAKSYKDKGNKKAAEKVLRNAAKRFKTSEIIQRYTGIFYFEEKNYSVASRFFLQAVAADKTSVEAQLGMARSMFEIGKYKEALAGFEYACKARANTHKYFREALSRLRFERNYQWQSKYSSKLYSCR